MFMMTELVISYLNSGQGEEATKQVEELLSLMINLDREWHPHDDLDTSQERIVKQLKMSTDSSKSLGNKFFKFGGQCTSNIS